jgi:hypothetical protein
VAVLSVDLAYRRWSDLGVVVLDRARTEPAPAGRSAGASPIHCEILPSGAAGQSEGPIDAEVLAGRLNHLCAVRGIRVMMLDGPQAWKSKTNGFAHARVSERELNTAAKTGLPGMVKPATYRLFAEFCLDVYDALCRRGWRRLDASAHNAARQERVPPERIQDRIQDRILVESYPYAAWKSLGLQPLPSKRRARVSDLAQAYGALRTVVPFTTDRPPNHDQLQAIVGGLSGLAIEERDTAGVRIVGNPPRREDGHWREGFIVLPLPPRLPFGLRWLN